MKRSNVFKAIRTIIGFLVAFYLIRFVIVSNDVNLREVWELVDNRLLFIAFIVYGLGFFVAAVRWHFLLHYIQVFLPMAVVIRLALIGQFFNLFVPGGVGGDLIKMIYLKKDAGDRYPEALLSVLLDRVLGLSGLLLVGLLAVAMNPSIMFHSSREMQAILAVVILAGVAQLVVSIFFVAWPYLGKFGHHMGSIQERLPGKVKGVLGRVLDAMSLLRSGPMMVIKLLLMAMVGHAFATLAVWIIGLGMGGTSEVNFQEYLLATQLSNLVGAVPLTPGGLGGRDLSLSFLLKLAGAAEEARGAIPLVVTGLIVAWSAVGGLALLWEKKHLPPQDREKTEFEEPAE
ncbi:MAG: lysylphosphatidylglycerol synthase transmembrane domain-containing protein [Vulcanimicrobiota bacterium]